MSKAEELLNSLVETYEAEFDASSDSHIVIGVDRFITVPEELRRIAVQYDHNMRTVTFDCPRYYDGRDMSKMKVYINIRGPKGAPYSYIADNVRIDTSNPTMMHFDWTIKRPLTDVYGKLIFLVCVRKADGEGNEENHWNTELNTELYISEGMEYEELEEYLYSDIVTQLLQRMDNVEALANPETMQGYANAWLDENSNKVLADIQSKGDGVLASIPEEYADVHANANEGVRTKADAIIRTVNGDVISVNDSSDDYLRGLRVFGRTDQITTTGKNMLQMASATRQYYEVTIYTNADGSVRAVGTPNAGDYPDFAEFDTGVVITLSANVEYILSGSANRMIYGLRKFSGEVVCLDEDGSGVRYTPSTDETVKLCVRLHRYETYDAISHPMLRLASNEDPSWEPYTGGAPSPSPDYPQDLVNIVNPTVDVYGKNLCDINKAIGVGATSIITIKDDCITIAPNEQVYGVRLMGDDSYAVLKKGVTYTCSCVYEGTHNNFWGWRFKKADGKWMQMGDSQVYTITPEMDIVAVGFYLGTPHSLASEAKISNIQVEIGDEATEYERYIEPRTIAIAHTLPGIPVSSGGNYIDANGQQWICDEVDFERGVYVRRIGKTAFAGMTWSQNSDGKYFANEARGLYSSEYPVRCTHVCGGIASNGNLENVIFINANNDIRLNLTLDEPSVDMVAFVMNDAEMIGAFKEPIETALSAEELNAFRAIRSNYHNTTVINDAGVKMELRYNADTQLYIDNKIAEAIAALNT